TVNTWWWRGVTGLLFENYIVDASILKLLSAISDKPGAPGHALAVWSGVVMVFSIAGNIY
ncbi:hypothetical protein QNO00_17230, partial [Arthrobacter sp. zg-Y1219]